MTPQKEALGGRQPVVRVCFLLLFSFFSFIVFVLCFNVNLPNHRTCLLKGAPSLRVG